MAVFWTRISSANSLGRLFVGALACAAATFGDASRSPSCLAQEQPVSQWAMTNSNISLESAAERQMMQMVVNTSREITADQSFKRIRIQNPNVLTALPLEGGNRLQISAIATGVTQIDLLGADDSVHTVEVMVLGDVRELEAILRQQFPDANLQVTPVQQGCIVSGFVTSDEHVNQVITIAELYFPTVINKVTVTGVHTIQLEAQIMEISRTKLRELGIDWAFANGDDAITQSVGGLLGAAGNTFTPTGSETFTLGVVENSSTFFSAVRALRQNSLVKVLASPTLTAIDGRPASFNSGGEIPIVVPAGLGQVGVQYREFGTRLDYVAKVRGNGRIYLEVRPYVSEIDPSRGVSIQGVSVPGLRSRFLETGVELGAGQTLALAGLLQVRTETISTGLPILADMPYLGALFRSTKEEQNEIELLITVTPNFAGPMDPHQVPCAALGVGSDSPTDHELYWRGYMETPTEACGDCGIGPGGIPGMGLPGPGVPGNGLIEELPTVSPYEGPPQASFPGYGTSAAPNRLAQPVPNPAAFNTGPDVPKLVTRPGFGVQRNYSLQQPSSYPPTENSGGQPPTVPPRAIIR